MCSVDFRELQYILTLAKAKTVSKAAEMLYISQPSLSQFLNRVEIGLGSKLFQRGPKGLTPTLVGEEYIRTARKILLQRKELHQRINDLAEMKRGKLTFGITSQRGGLLLPDVMSAFRQKHPGIKLKILEQLSTDDLEKMALEGECDVFISNLPLQHPEISYRTIIDDCLHLVLPPSYPLPCSVAEFTFEKTLDLIRSMRDYDFIVPPLSSMKMGGLVKTLFHLLEFEPRIILETHSFEAAQYMALGGGGATFVHRSVFIDRRMQEKPIYIPINDSRFRTPLVAGFSNSDYISGLSNLFYREICDIIRSKTEAENPLFGLPRP